MDTNQIFYYYYYFYIYIFFCIHSWQTNCLCINNLGKNCIWPFTHMHHSKGRALFTDHAHTFQCVRLKVAVSQTGIGYQIEYYRIKHNFLCICYWAIVLRKLIQVWVCLATCSDSPCLPNNSLSNEKKKKNTSSVIHNVQIFTMCDFSVVGSGCGPSVQWLFNPSCYFPFDGYSCVLSR